ncbi:uncharacterized protein [Rutidosis leptorrhynchoides]|uniref:uncharacterized protein isoform X2 n=1 Tax=Rutidosis leptorrhynchoides TaxID=125765 RepID=UPI003A98F84B
MEKVGQEREGLLMEIENLKQERDNLEKEREDLDEKRDKIKKELESVAPHKENVEKMNRLKEEKLNNPLQQKVIELDYMCKSLHEQITTFTWDTYDEDT